MKFFQVISKTGKVKELDEKTYLSRLNRQGYHLGWIDDRDVYFVLPTLLTKWQLSDIERLGGWLI